MARRRAGPPDMLRKAGYENTFSLKGGLARLARRQSAAGEIAMADERVIVYSHAVLRLLQRGEAAADEQRRSLHGDRRDDRGRHVATR